MSEEKKESELGKEAIFLMRHLLNFRCGLRRGKEKGDLATDASSALSPHSFVAEAATVSDFPHMRRQQLSREKWKFPIRNRCVGSPLCNCAVVVADDGDAGVFNNPTEEKKRCASYMIGTYQATWRVLVWMGRARGGGGQVFLASFFDAAARSVIRISQTLRSDARVSTEKKISPTDLDFSLCCR